MPSDYLWKTEREAGLERHEVFGAYNRDKSIEDGLVIFLTPMQHREGKNAIHKNEEFRIYAQTVGYKTWCKYYKKTKEDFRKRYGFIPTEKKGEHYD